DGQRLGRYTTDLSVAVDAAPPERKRGDHDDLGADQRAAIAALDSGRTLDYAHLLEHHAAVHLGRGAGAPDDRVTRRSRGHQRRLEAAREGEHGHENTDG